ncbi:MAG: gliding motility-associated C-terminal domain-containing protein [Cyclobacteriaceae bacterium]|nr:gliding motility-associated C-terminal domain-containing protein [Cyclobacteriaceae bacterium]
MHQIRHFLIAALLLIFSAVAYAQPATVTVDEIRNPCGASVNGSIRITVTAGAGPFTYFLIGFNTPIVLSANLALGVPTVVPNLPPDNYLLIVSDNDPAPNFQQAFNLVSSPIITGSVDPGFPVNNTGCTTPDGAISVTINGGTGAYSYLWAGPSGYTNNIEDISGLAGGDYLLLVTDAGSSCNFQLGPIKITDPEPALQSITNTGTQLICVGDDAVVNLSGSETTVTYEVLVNGFSVGIPTVNGTGGSINIPVPAGSFTDGDALVVQARSGICTPILMNGVIITDIVALVTNSVVTNNTSCISFNGAIDLTVTGSAGPFTYQWSGPNGFTNNTDQDISNLEQGNYTVIVTDVPSGCTLNSVIVVGDSRPVLTVDNLTFADVSCFGGNDGSIQIAVIGGAGSISYTITPDVNLVGSVALGNFTNLPAGNYTVRATDAVSGCFIDVIQAISQPPAPTADAGPDQTVCAGDNVVLAGVIGGSATGASWSGGTGVFTPDNLTLNATYTPSAAEITAGTVTLTLTTIDPDGAGPCTVAFDQVTITINPAATADAGADQTICSGNTVSLSGVIGGSALSSTWSTSGDGTFSDASILNPIYTPGPNDVTSGSVTLTLTTDDPSGPCLQVSDVILITINPLATVNAGLDQEICSGQTVTLAGSFGGAASSAIWTTAGDGTFDNASSLTAIYTPGPNDIIAGTVTLTLTTDDPSGPCSPAIDDLIVTITPVPIVNAGADQEICSGQTVSLTGLIGGSASSATWTTSGDGTFDNAGSLTAIYTPGANDISTGTVTLTLTTNDPAGNCPSVNDAAVITITPAATVNAGADQEICSDQTVNLIGVIGGSASSASWTTSGDGTFDNAGSLTAIYTPGVNDIIAGTVTLTLTTDDPAGNCPSVNDAVIITITPAATANAGADQEICSDQTVSLTGVIGGSASSATWTTSGDGSFDNINSLTAIYTPGLNDLTNGTVTLTLTTDDPSGNCGSVSDVIIISISPAPTVNAGPDQAICSGNTVALNGIFGGSASSASWSTLGDGSFDNVNSLTAVYTPGPNDLTAGTVTLTLTTDDPAGNCGPVNDIVIITITPAATADAGTDQEICSNQTVSLNGVIGGSASTGTWTTSGDGVFDNANSLTAVYTPGTSDLTTGAVTLTLTTDDPAGDCTPASDAVDITITPSATVNAGIDQEICSGQSVSLNGIIGGSASNASWSTSGDGSFDNVNSLTAIYTPGPNDLTAGTVTLTLTTNDPVGNCSASSDALLITITPLPTVNAGADLDACSDQSVTLNGSIGGSASSATWTTSGDGTFNNVNLLAAIYTPGPNDLVAGTVSLTLTTDDPAGNCSSVNDLLVVTFSTAALVDAGPDVSVCSGNTVSLNGTFGGSASSAVWTTAGDGTFDNPNSLTAIYTPGANDLTAGTVTLTLTTDDPAGVCSAVSDNLVVTISSAPTATLSGTNTICQGEATNLTFILTGVGPWNLVYTDGTNNFPVNNIASSPLIISVTPGTTTTYSLVSISDTCAPAGTVNGTAIITVQPLAPPTSATLSGDATICNGENTDLSVTIAGGTGPFEVTINDGTSNILISNYSDGTPISVSPVTSTTYTLVSVVDNNGCNSLALAGTATVTVNQGPTAATLQGTISICTGGTAVLSVAITGGIGPYSFTIDNGVGLISNYISGDPINVAPLVTTTYAIVGNVTDANGCIIAGTGTADVTVSSAPTAAISGTASICDGQFTDLTITLTGVGPWDIVYSDGSSNISVTGILTSPLIIPVSPVATTTYTLVSVDDTCGAGTVSGSATITKRLPTDPVCIGIGIGCFAYTIVIDNTLTQRPSCDNQNDGVIAFNVTGTVPGNYIIQLISPTDTLSQVGPSGLYVFSNLSPNAYSYRIEDVNGNICQQPFNLPLETSVVATASGFIDVACFGTSTGQATFTVTSGGNSPYEYSVDGLTWFSFLSGQSVTNLPPNGTYTVLIRDDENDLCPYPVSVTINNINPAITIDFDTQDATCGNNDGSISIVTPPAGGTGGPYTFKVDGTDAVPVNDTFENLFGGNHIITVIDNSGCERNFTVFVPYPDFILIAAVNSTDASCTQLGSIGILIDNFIPSAPYEVAITNSISTVPVDFLGQYYLGNGLVLITELTRGDYFVWIRTSGSQCPTLVNNIINNLPITLAGPVPVSFDVSCRFSNGDLQLTNISGAPGLPYQFEVFGNGFLVTGNLTPDPLGNAVISGFTSGQYAVNLIQDQGPIGGCPTASSGYQNAPLASLDTVSVRVPDPFAKFDQSFPEKGTASRIIRIQESGLGDYEIRLELVDAFGSPDPNPIRDWTVINNQEIQYSDLFAGNYILSLRDGYGCQKNYNLTIDMFTGIWIPNIFTPNNDGYNDTFYIRNLPASGADLIVSNRWGNQVFSSSDYQNEWDGANQADGVYYYRLQVNGEVYTGWIEIMRGSKP